MEDGKANVSDFDRSAVKALVLTVMPAGDEFSPTDEISLSPTPDLDITVIHEGSDVSESEQIGEGDIISHELDHKQLFGIESSDLDVLDLEGNDLENGDEQVLEVESNDLEFSKNRWLEGNQCKDIENGDESGSAASANLKHGISNGNVYPPLVGMEFDSYDDAYNYYNNYGKDLGFAIRVKSSWTKRNSKEKRGAVLCCNCEGFKMMKEASSRRKETRTGCLAMLRLRLVESNKWRVDEAKLEHNHLFDPERAQQSKSQKKMDATGLKRKLESPPDIEVRTIKLYRTPTHTVSIDTSGEREIGDNSDLSSKCLKLQAGDVRVMNDFFRCKQLTDPNFFYSMDLNDDGHLRNVFWIDSRSRAAYSHFGDVVALDTTCLSNEYTVPVFTFLGINHHGQSIILGCGLLADEISESYVWLLRVWLTCMLGRPPQTILTEQGNALQNAIAEVFPRVQHRVSSSLVVKKILRNLSELEKYELFQQTLSETVYSSNKIDEFEMAWEDMIRRFGLTDLDWLQSLYEERERWAPVYSKDTFLAGTFVSQPCKLLKPAFEGYVHEQTQLKELFDSYELIFQQQIRKESTHDVESREFNPTLKTRCTYELQLSKVYTKEIFSKFQVEVEMMSSCLSVTQSHTNGPVVTYTIKEHDDNNIEVTNHRVLRTLEVMFDKSIIEVRCICNCFSLEGYLCRHALCVLNYHAIDEIPAHYILPRWRKDFKRLYVPDAGPDNIDVSNIVQWFDHLHRRAMQVVGGGTISQDHYMVAWHALKESLNKVRLVADKRL